MLEAYKVVEQNNLMQFEWDLNAAKRQGYVLQQASVYVSGDGIPRYVGVLHQGTEVPASELPKTMLNVLRPQGWWTRLLWRTLRVQGTVPTDKPQDAGGQK